MITEKLKTAVVTHKAYGKGIVKGLSEKYLEVEFAAQEKPRKFLYPDAFETYLSVEDETLQQQIAADLAERNAELQAQRSAEEEKAQAMEAEFKANHRAMMIRRRKSAEDRKKREAKEKNKA